MIRHLKRAGAYLAGKFFRKKSFPLLGVPAGTTTGLKKGEGRLTFFYPGELLPLRPPKTIESQIRFRQMLKGENIPAMGLLSVEKGTATWSGGNLSQQGKLITTFLQSPPKHDSLGLSIKNFFPTLYISDCPVVTLATVWQGAFYHWVYEVLTRLHLVEQGGFSQEKLYVEAAAPFQKESLELLGIPKERIINAQVYKGVQAPELIIPSIPQTPTFWGCQFLRESILPRLSTRAPLRLYVSRGDATRRRMLNEEQVFALLKKYGFEKVHLSRMSFKEQAELFSAAEVVVGPHGAGFSHLVFCRPRTPFLEIFSPAFFNPCYWHVCERVGLEYYYLFGEGKHQPNTIPPQIDPDIEVDIGKLEASLKLMGL